MLNTISIQGRMTNDAEAKTTASGNTFYVFGVACQRNYKNAEGKYDADFFDCVANGATGEHISRYFKKGNQVLLTGEMQTRTYDDNNGIKHKVATVVVNKAYFCGDKNNTQPTQANAAPTAPNSPSEAYVPSGDSELPFE